MTSRNARILLYLVTAICLLSITLMRQRSQEEQPSSPSAYTMLEGSVFHTIYHIQYDDATNYRTEIQQLFDQFDGSLSMFNDTSLITRVNQCDETVIANRYLSTVLQKAQQISQLTDGAFDITVAPLVNLWGFGFKNSDNVSDQVVDSILQFVGYDKIQLDADGHVHKSDPRVILDASAIAKGYMCDVVADFLKDKGVSNFMVEIGGEINCSGLNPRGKLWGVGINEPTEDSLQINTELRDVMHLTDCSIATSGNYRNFYYKDGQRFAHTIDPHTGYPAQQDILSSTVIARECITADALATSFMVLGSEKALRILEADTTLMAYFICSKAEGEGYEVIYSPKLKNMLDSQNTNN